MNWTSAAAGAIGLMLLYRVVSLDSAGQSRFASLVALPASWARKLMDPTVPLIPQLSTSAGTQPSANTTPAGTPAPAVPHHQQPVSV